MVRFSDEDKMLLYITRTTAEELGSGSWDDCTTIFNYLASCSRTQDGLSAAYRSLEKTRLEAEARTAAWDATREQVREWLLKASPKEGAPWDDPKPRFGQTENEDSGEVVCPAPKRTLTLPLTEWIGANAQMDLGLHAPSFPQQGASSEEQRWAADGYVFNAALWPVQAAEYPFAGSTATGLDAALMHGTVDNEPIYGDSSATYNAGNWSRWGADSPCLYGAGGSYMHGAGDPAMYGDSSYMYGDSSYMYGDNSYMYGHDTCMSGTGATCMNAAGSLDVFPTDITTGTTIGNGSSPSRNTAVEGYSTTATTTTTPSCYVPNSPGAGTFSYTASSSADYGPIPTEFPSESSSFGQVVPVDTHPQGLNAESTSIMNTEGLMSSEELNSLLESIEAGFDAI
ncbi:hypothetical protein TUN199_08999 [Pyrenophora tritici-repentis]|nr:hypothetical protein TUN205_09008 [Pyrenophora tritici-repentis]KAI0619011.1 hypothetical protein TUN199_08999 [Pyrenophora tritici-repentis]